MARYQIDGADQQRHRLEQSAARSPGACAVQLEVSGTATTSEVVLSMEISSLPVGGMITRIACGSTIRRMIWAQRHAQRRRRLGLALVHRGMPARTISAMYAASFSASPMTAATKNVITLLGLEIERTRARTGSRARTAGRSR